MKPWRLNLGTASVRVVERVLAVGRVLVVGLLPALERVLLTAPRPQQVTATRMRQALQTGAQVHL